MIAFGFSRAIASSALVEGHDLAVDAGLAHAPGDELGDLAAEIDDEDGVGHRPSFAPDRKRTGLREAIRVCNGRGYATG